MNIPTYCKDLGFEPNNIFQNVLGSGWMYVVGLTLSTMVFLVALFYMAAHFLREEKLKAWARFELFQIVANVFLLLIIVGLLHWMCTFDVSGFYKWINPSAGAEIVKDIVERCNLKTNQEIVTPYCSMNNYIYKLKLYGKGLYGPLFILGFFLSLITKFSVGAHPIGMGFNIEPGAGFAQLTNLMTVAMSGYILTFISVYVQEKLIKFFLIAIPYYFLPIGLLLRSFFATREFGGAVLGFSIASLFFYPFTFVLADIATSESYQPLEVEKITNALQKDLTNFNLAEKTGDILQKSGGDPNKIFQNQQQDKTSQPIDDKELQQEFSKLNEARDLSEYIKLGGLIGIRLFSKGGIFGWTMNILIAIQGAITLINIVFHLLPKYFIGAGVIPLINFIIYIQATASLSQLLGSRLDISNITRMI